MRVRFKNRTGYDRWADIEEVTMLIRQDGTVVTSLPDAFCNERLLTSEETRKAIEFLNQEKENTRYDRSHSRNAETAAANQPATTTRRREVRLAGGAD